MINEKNDYVDREILVYDLGIFELRGLARKLGVPSPTTKKRDELISLILEKIKSGDVIDQTGKKKGRPFKSLSAIDEIYSSITSNSSDEDDYYIQDYNSLQSNFNTQIVFKQDIEKRVYQDEQFTCTGIVRENGDQLIFYDMETGRPVYISSLLEYYMNLRVGDKVCVKAQDMNENSQLKANEILTINDVSVRDYRPLIKEEGEPIISDKKLSLGQREIYVGRRNLMQNAQDLYEDQDELKALIECCKNENKHLVVLGINLSYEDMIMFKNYDLDKFISAYGRRDAHNFTLIIDAINYCDRLDELDRDVVLYVVDIVEVVKALERFFSSGECKIDPHKNTHIILEKIMSLGKAYLDGNSVTLILGYNELDKDDKILRADIMKVCKIV